MNKTHFPLILCNTLYSDFKTMATHRKQVICRAWLRNLEPTVHRKNIIELLKILEENGEQHKFADVCAAAAETETGNLRT